MNKMKPEDVMKALEWYDVVCENIGSITLSIAEMKAIRTIIREKDALIAELTQTIAKKTKVIEDLQLGWSEDQERTRRLLDAKDDEIGRLIKERDEARRDVGCAERNHYESAKEVDSLRHICTCYALQYGTVMDQSKAVKEIRAKAITEFEERLKAHECLPEYPWDEPFVLAGCIDQIAKEMRGEI